MSRKSALLFDFFFSTFLVLTSVWEFYRHGFWFILVGNAIWGKIFDIFFLYFSKFQPSNGECICWQCFVTQSGRFSFCLNRIIKQILLSLIEDCENAGNENEIVIYLFFHYLVSSIDLGQFKTALLFLIFISYPSNQTDWSCLFVGSLDSVVVPFLGKTSGLRFCIDWRLRKGRCVCVYNYVFALIGDCEKVVCVCV